MGAPFYFGAGVICFTVVALRRFRRTSAMHEYVGNLHMHSTDSDGHGTHQHIAEAAMRAGLDFVVVSDHNLLHKRHERYYFKGDRRLLMLIGQEVHDTERTPERSHLLIYGAEDDLATFAPDPQALVDQARQRGALTFLAHPTDCAAEIFGESDLSWADWGVRGYTGLEIWNFMSEFKCRLSSWPRAVYYSYFPSQVARGPAPEILERWDAQLGAGLRTVAIGNSDAHALPVKAGPFRRVIFPYEWLFRAVNTHVLLPEPLSGELPGDAAMIYEALRTGHCFVGYDRGPRSDGFRFKADADRSQVGMGEQLQFKLGATLQVRCPRPADIRLVRHGTTVRRWERSQHAVQTVNRDGAYRVEVQLEPDRGWIYSNPIFLERITR